MAPPMPTRIIGMVAMVRTTFWPPVRVRRVLAPALGRAWPGVGLVVGCRAGVLVIGSGVLSR